MCEKQQIEYIKSHVLWRFYYNICLIVLSVPIIFWYAFYYHLVLKTFITL